MRDLVQDLRYAARLLAKSPGFTLVAVITLALGIGANAAIFSVVDAVLLEPLPYRHPDRLMSVYSQFPGLGFDRFWVSAPELLELRERAKSFEEMGAYAIRAANLTSRDEPLRVTTGLVTAGLFTTLGVAPERGRVFTPAEDLPNAEQVAVLGYDLWQRAFGGDPAVVGRRVEVNDTPRTVVGIMPPGFDVADSRVELWLPLALDPANPGGRGSHFLYLIGRLRPEANLAAARAELEALLGRWPEEIPDEHTPNTDDHRLVITPLLDDLVGTVRPKMRILLAAVGLVLAIACANVANLLLARSEARQREIAVRTALGARRGRLLRQFLTESVLLALAGGALGVVLAFWGVRALVATNPDGIPRAAGIGLDGRVLLATLAVALVTGLLFGLAPALHARASTFFSALKEGGQRTTSGAGRLRLQRALVVAEIAVAAALVISAGLLLKSFWLMTRVDPGFEAAGVLTFQVATPPTSYPEDHQVTGFYDELTRRLAALPGVESAAAMNGLPPQRDVNANDTEFEGLPQDGSGPPQNVDYWQFVTRDYLETMRIRVVAGRGFTAADDRGTTPVALVNETLAKVFWPGQDPLGKRLRAPGDDAPWLTVVGVVRDVKQGGLDREAGTELYFLHPQSSETVGGVPRTMNVVVRAAGDPEQLASAARSEVRRLDPRLPVAQLRTMEEVVAGSLAAPRFLTLLVGLFAVVALALAAVGTYGVLAYAVAQRTRELGLRVALGAQAADVRRLVLGEGGRLAGLGLGLGVGGALAARQLLASQLFGVAPTDLATFAGVVGLLAAVALVACWLPARRATRVDPLTALRAE